MTCINCYDVYYLFQIAVVVCPKFCLIAVMLIWTGFSYWQTHRNDQNIPLLVPYITDTWFILKCTSGWFMFGESFTCMSSSMSYELKLWPLWYYFFFPVYYLLQVNKNLKTRVNMFLTPFQFLVSKVESFLSKINIFLQVVFRRTSWHIKWFFNVHLKCICSFIYMQGDSKQRSSTIIWAYVLS